MAPAKKGVPLAPNRRMPVKLLINPAVGTGAAAPSVAIAKSPASSGRTITIQPELMLHNNNKAVKNANVFLAVK
jgi:hypothetical protein